MDLAVYVSSKEDRETPEVDASIAKEVNFGREPLRRNHCMTIVLLVLLLYG